MCFSAIASFAAAAPLIGGGIVCLKTALNKDPKYRVMSVMPLAVGFQQVVEGFIWVALGIDIPSLAHVMALSYMFFVWVFWPFWVPFMCAGLEPDAKKRNVYMKWAQTGLIFGLLLYLPHIYMQGWLAPNINNGCIAYNTVIIFDYLIPREITSFIYLMIIAVPPLSSSHAYLRIFGLLLLFLVPLTYYLFIHAYISVLCFFAAITTAFLVYIVLLDKCGAEGAQEKQASWI